jgi:hypothetical protein
VLEIKSAVVHFQGKVFNPSCFLAYQLVDVGRWWGEHLIRELKLEGVNHHRVKEWVKTVYVPESTCHREALLPQRRKIPPKAHL